MRKRWLIQREVYLRMSSKIGCFVAVDLYRHKCPRVHEKSIQQNRGSSRISQLRRGARTQKLTELSHEAQLLTMFWTNIDAVLTPHGNKSRWLSRSWKMKSNAPFWWAFQFETEEYCRQSNIPASSVSLECRWKCPSSRTTSQPSPDDSMSGTITKHSYLRKRIRGLCSVKNWGESLCGCELCEQTKPLWKITQAKRFARFAQLTLRGEFYRWRQMWGDLRTSFFRNQEQAQISVLGKNSQAK